MPATTQKTDRLLIALLALMPVLAIEMPRMLAFLPALTGLFYLACNWFLTRRAPLQWPALGTLLALWVSLALLSALWSVAPAESLERAGKMAGIFLAGYILALGVSRLSPAIIKTNAWYIPAGLAAAALLLFAELATNAPLYRLIRGLNADINFSEAVFNRGAVTLTLLFFPVLCCVDLIPRSSAFKILLTILLGASLLATQSQSAQLGLVLAGIIYVAFPYSKAWAWRALITLIVCLIFAAPFLAIWLFDHFVVTLNTMPFFGLGDGYAGARLEIWDFVARYALQSPLIGHGIEASRVITDFDTAQLYHKGDTVLHPHNFALQLWLEFGVIGALSASAFFVYMIQAIRMRMPLEAQKAALPSIVCAISIGATGYGMWQSWWLGLLLFILAINIMIYQAQKNEPDVR